MKKLVLAAAAAIALCGQTEDRLKYEVASIRPANPKELFVRIEAGAGGSFHATSITLQQLVMSAYNLRDFQVSGGPEWADKERYNVLAKPEEPEPRYPLLRRAPRSRAAPRASASGYGTC
jgi:hypothetical protein